MKKKLALQSFLGFLLCLVLSFVITSTLTGMLTEHYVLNQTAESLYKEALLVSQNYIEDYNGNQSSLKDLQERFEALEAYLNAQVWIVSSKGEILVNSHEEVEDISDPYVIESFNATDFNASYYQEGTFYDYFSEDYLSVYTPITRNYQLSGYVVLHMKESNIFNTSVNLLNVSYINGGVILLLFFIYLLWQYFHVIRPLQKTAKTAGEFASGNFENHYVLHRNDELGFLTASLDYMAIEMNTLEEDQKKFISNISHDFRSPLTSIRGYINAILDGTIPPELQDRYLNTILFETERLTKLTSGILELNKYGSHGKTILDYSEFDVNQVLKQTIRSFEMVCSEKKITFDLLLTGEKLFVKADMGKIQQVIYNLIDNAIKFSSNNSSIHIETTIKNGKVFVAIKDHGCGIPKDSINKIWERFYKSDSSRGKDKKGTGLGLSIVKEIITAHEENINVISTEGVGTEFIFSLRLSKKNEEAE